MGMEGVQCCAGKLVHPLLALIGGALTQALRLKRFDLGKGIDASPPELAEAWAATQVAPSL
jgi:hypothetical protein